MKVITIRSKQVYVLQSVPHRGEVITAPKNHAWFLGAVTAAAVEGLKASPILFKKKSKCR